MLKYAHGIKNWHTQITIPSLNFKFKFRLPKPRKAREILKRDVYGRILETTTPKLKLA